MIERSNGCSEVAAHERLLRRGRDAARKAMFDEIRALYGAGSPVTEIARKLGLGPRRVHRWVRRPDLPEPSAMAPKACTPAYFGAFLARSWAEGTAKVRHLFSDIRHRGYTGSYIDEWAWRKRTTFGTVIVDLERLPATRTTARLGRTPAHSFTLRRIVVSLTGMPSLAISRSEGRPPTLWPNSLTIPANRAVRRANGVASVGSRSAKIRRSH